MLFISHFKWFLVVLYCSVSRVDSLLMYKLYFTEERFSSKTFQESLSAKVLPTSLKGQMPLKISKMFCRCSLTILMERDATLQIYLLVKTL